MLHNFANWWVVLRDDSNLYPPGQCTKSLTYSGSQGTFEDDFSYSQGGIS